MSDRITKCFAKAKAEGRGAFVSYLTMGYPTLRQSEDAVDDLVAGGVDIGVVKRIVTVGEEIAVLG